MSEYKDLLVRNDSIAVLIIFNIVIIIIDHTSHRVLLHVSEVRLLVVFLVDVITLTSVITIITIITIIIIIITIIITITTEPDPVAQWAKPRLIGHSACWPDGLRTLTDLGTNPGLEGVFQLNWTSGHVICM